MGIGWFVYFLSEKVRKVKIFSDFCIKLKAP